MDSSSTLQHSSNSLYIAATIWYEVLQCAKTAKEDYELKMAFFDGEDGYDDTKYTRWTSQYWGAHLRFFKHLCIGMYQPYDFLNI